MQPRRLRHSTLYCAVRLRGPIPTARMPTTRFDRVCINHDVPTASAMTNAVGVCAYLQHVPVAWRGERRSSVRAGCFPRERVARVLRFLCVPVVRHACRVLVSVRPNSLVAIYSARHRLSADLMSMVNDTIDVHLYTNVF